jgi:nitrogen fixation protein
MSALPPKADIAERQLDVRFVPKADIDGRLINLGDEHGWGGREVTPGWQPSELKSAGSF